MTMIKLSDGCYVATDQIAEVKVNDYSTSITVRTKDGIGHCHQPRYGEGVYAALDRLIAEINAATSNAEVTCAHETTNVEGVALTAELDFLPCPFCGGKPHLETRDVEPQGDPGMGRK